MAVDGMGRDARHAEAGVVRKFLFTNYHELTFILTGMFLGIALRGDLN